MYDHTALSGHAMLREPSMSCMSTGRLCCTAAPVGTCLCVCRDKASVQRSLAAKDDLELLLAAAAHVPQQTDEGSLAGMHDGRLHEAAAAADQYAPSLLDFAAIAWCLGCVFWPSIMLE